jgi:antitoxin component YwqK of YwqJK toxin-antitoxin module
MKQTLYTLFLLAIQTAFGQIIFEPTFINPCTNKVEEVVFWNLTDKDTMYEPDYEKLKKVSVKKSGTYSLNFIFQEESIDIEIPNKEIHRDTFLLQRVQLAIYVSNPPHSEYFDCDSLANGQIIDRYKNGNKRKQGIFKNGQPVDSLFTYYRSGQLSKLFIPRKDDWKKLAYYKNGQLQSLYDTKKRYEKEYYENGQLKKEYAWSKKRYKKSIEYHENGVVHKKIDHKNLEVFDTNGNLIKKIKRKRTHSYIKDYYGRKRKNYKYKWQTFNQNGTLQRSIVFESEGLFIRTPFPDSIQQIDAIFIDEVTFFENGKIVRKLEPKYVSEDGEYNQKLFIYRKEDTDWIEEKMTTMDDIFKIITEYSK